MEDEASFMSMAQTNCNTGPCAGRLASMVKAADDPCQPVVFLSDALSVLRALKNNNFSNRTEALQKVRRVRRPVLQWVPFHCEMPENERADKLAKQEAQENQPGAANSDSYCEKKSIIRSLQRMHQERDDHHLLFRK